MSFHHCMPLENTAEVYLEPILALLKKVSAQIGAFKGPLPFKEFMTNRLTIQPSDGHEGPLASYTSSNSPPYVLDLNSPQLGYLSRLANSDLTCHVLNLYRISKITRSGIIVHQIQNFALNKLSLYLGSLRNQ